MSEKNIKILMVGLLPLELDQVKGGVVAVIRNLFLGFNKLSNIEIIHVSYNEEIKTPVTKQYSHNIRIHYLPYRVNLKIVDYFINRSSIAEIIKRECPDIVHIQEVTPHLLRFLFFPRKIIVVTQHGVMREEAKYEKGIRNRFKNCFKAFIESSIFPLFRNIIFISEYNRSLFKGGGGHNKIIFNPVNPLYFESISIKSVNNSIIYVGVINKRKNLKLLLDALKKLKRDENISFNLTVVGGYKDFQYEREIQKVLDDNIITNDVHFTGWKSQEEILSLYRASQIFVLPSQQESMPVSIGEAMAQGRVVVAANTGAIHEMITDKISGFLFESNNVDQLCTVLKLLHTNQELIGIVSKNARMEAESKFHPDLIASKTTDFYNEVLKNISS